MKKISMLAAALVMLVVGSFTAVNAVEKKAAAPCCATADACCFEGAACCE